MNSAADPTRAFPACRAVLGQSEWNDLAAEWEKRGRPDFLRFLTQSRAGRDIPWLVELAGLEVVLAGVRGRADEVPAINPTAELYEADHTGLARVLAEPGAAAEPKPGRELLLAWYDPKQGDARAAVAAEDLLLALKLAARGRKPSASDGIAGRALAAARAALERAARMGLVLVPASRIRRAPDFGEATGPDMDAYLAADVFTLQWHVTQACDLHCRHCYDRSERRRMSLEQGRRVLDELERFCAYKNVEGQVTFTGGNPLMHPQLTELYGEAAERGFRVALLANPASRKTVEELVEIKRPEYFQVSLEGLEEHNDHIRGRGHFRRTLEFLETLDEFGVYSMVMLTLTAANMAQVVPLTRELEGRCDLFTFNRLSAVGEGANLAMAPVEGFREFLAEYLDAAADNPCMGLKESLLNPVLAERGDKGFGGCAGFGCGAAFNFVAVTPEGDVHACRKFPSKIGNLFEQELIKVYDSPAAARHRAGSAACAGCGFKPVCGGCQAVTSSLGLDPFTERDPYCFAPPV
jgi:selenobiotic family peptide radical SAM maturase